MITVGVHRSRALAILGSAGVLGLLVAIASWGVPVFRPGAGLDPSWQSALYMAAHQGLLAGQQAVFTYGPLGFLAVPGIWYDGLTVLAFVYSGALYVALSVSLLWALRRTLHTLLALVVTYLLLIVTPAIEVPVALAAVWCLVALAPDPPDFAEPLVRYAGAALGAVEVLVLLRTGPVILFICTLTLLVGENRWQRLSIFTGVAVVSFAVAWLAAGQTLGNLTSYLANGGQIVLGYSQAMGVGGRSGLEVAVCALLVVVLVAAAVLGSGPGRARWAAGIVIGVTGFALFKESIIRQDAGHLQVFYSTVIAIGAGIHFGQRRALAALAAAFLVVLAIIMPYSPYQSVQYSPISHVRLLGQQVKEVASPDSQRTLGGLGMAIVYHLDAQTLALLRGHRVHIDPWEAALAWLYKLNWDPLPVFQNYSAYTSTLDHLNASKLASADGPDRILRENIQRKYSGDIDQRNQTWDPPAQAIAMLCHYESLRTTVRWQVLVKVSNRCGTPRLLSTLRIGQSQIALLPPEPTGGVLYARLEGVGLGGTESIRSLLYRAPDRSLLVNRTHLYRLVPGTAADGLLMGVPSSIDFPPPFRLSPSAQTIQVLGIPGSVTIRLYVMPVRAASTPALSHKPR